MLPTFVIGLREGLEAALIVGIIAAFLRKQGRQDLLRWVAVGVTVAIALCVLGGVLLQAFSRALPQREQEGLETVIGAVAVAMVTYMVVWMRRHSRGLKGQLEGLAVAASGRGARAMVGMAFLAVIREGFETVVFLLAAFHESGGGAGAAVGASTGIAVAVALGWGIYRGGVRINLSRFFRATGLVLVLVAAGLVVNALDTAHEAGWLDAGQGSTIDLTWLVRPGSVQSSLLTGMLGIQAHPVTVELVAWLVYVVPVGCYVAWPPGRPAPLRALVVAGVVVAAAAAAGSLALAVQAPSAPAPDRRVSTVDARSATLRVDGAAYRLAAVGAGSRAGVPAGEYRSAGADVSARTSLSAAQVAGANGGRLPIGVRAGADGRVPALEVRTTSLVAWVEPRTHHLVALVREVATRLVVGASALAPTRQTVPVVDDVTAARAALDRLERRATLHSMAAWLRAVALAGAVVAVGAGCAARWRRRVRAALAARRPLPELAHR